MFVMAFPFSLRINNEDLGFHHLCWLCMVHTLNHAALWPGLIHLRHQSQCGLGLWAAEQGLPSSGCTLRASGAVMLVKALCCMHLLLWGSNVQQRCCAPCHPAMPSGTCGNCSSASSLHPKPCTIKIIQYMQGQFCQNISFQAAGVQSTVMLGFPGKYGRKEEWI